MHAYLPLNLLQNRQRTLGVHKNEVDCQIHEKKGRNDFILVFMFFGSRKNVIFEARTFLWLTS